ncbi:hypothetical protein BDK51DRAFT_48033 [Blyttiomyces helicus]|uniref:SnoaL-like domain-containing protein n=1 Tax=Blyttiomyces helicus TaxID=388810 RepID=A0A4P9W5X7_9FUNG|nr:hypothetical protein BDK51DRAFT_48033 [Blyttiomyces helicus]|eukprot:RKO87841.1 hypothetical protein BDK51DRAFT_48033 [Blyttiomyces helicus]
MPKKVSRIAKDNRGLQNPSCRSSRVIHARSERIEVGGSQYDQHWTSQLTPLEALESHLVRHQRRKHMYSRWRPHEDKHERALGGIRSSPHTGAMDLALAKETFTDQIFATDHVSALDAPEALVEHLQKPGALVPQQDAGHQCFAPQVVQTPPRPTRSLPSPSKEHLCPPRDPILFRSSNSSLPRPSTSPLHPAAPQKKQENKMTIAASRPASPATLAAQMLHVWDTAKGLRRAACSPQQAEGLAASLFDREATLLAVPTAHGAEGLPAIQLFVKKCAEQGKVFIDEKIVSRVINGSFLCEESILTMIHEERIDWLLPDVKPTNRRVQIPMCIVASFNGEGKIASERIYWDQGSVMKQIGLLPATLFCKGNNSETTLPVIGPKIIDGLVKVEGPIVTKEDIDEMEDHVADSIQRPEAPLRYRASMASLHGKRDSMSSLISQEDMNHPTPAPTPVPTASSRSSDIFSQDTDISMRTNRRDPNWSSINSHDDAPLPTTTGRKTFEGRTVSQFSLGADAPTAPTAPAAESSVAAGIAEPVHRLGRKFSAASLRTSDIFGEHAEPIRPSSKRDPNARSTEKDFIGIGRSSVR